MSHVLKRPLNESTPAIALQLDHISLFVRDRDASAHFYQEVLGRSRSREQDEAPAHPLVRIGLGPVDPFDRRRA